MRLLKFPYLESTAGTPIEAIERPDEHFLYQIELFGNTKEVFTLTVSVNP